MEGLQAIHLLTNPDILDGLARHCLHGQGCPTPGITVELGEDHTADFQPFIESFSHIDSILACHGVHNQENLRGIHRGFDLHQLFHELLIHMQPAGGI